MQHIIIMCFQAVTAKLDCKRGYFDLIGCDFFIDEDFKWWDCGDNQKEAQNHQAFLNPSPKEQLHPH